VDTNKLNDMVANDDWLFQNMVTAYYDVLGVVRDSGLEMRVGHVKGIATEAGSFFASCYYSRPFLPGARPVVVPGVSSATAMLYILGTRGLDNRAIPDHRGFLCHFSQLRPTGAPTKFFGEQYAAYFSIAPRS
jgi:hypothetical protein